MSGAHRFSEASHVSSILSIGVYTIGAVVVASLYTAFTKSEEKDVFAARITKMKWGVFRGKRACLIGVEITINPGSRQKLKTASFSLGNLAEISANEEEAESKTSSNKCRLLLWEPVSHEGTPVIKAVKRGGALEPKASILGNEVGVGSLSYSEDFNRTYRGTIQTKLLAGDDGKITGVTWTLAANKAEPSGVQHMTNVALLIQHSGEPFTLEFSSQPLPSENRYAFWKRKQAREPDKRTFLPPVDSEKVIQESDLKRFVAGTLVS